MPEPGVPRGQRAGAARPATADYGALPVEGDVEEIAGHARVHVDDELGRLLEIREAAFLEDVRLPRRRRVAPLAEGLRLQDDVRPLGDQPVVDVDPPRILTAH